MAESFSYPSNLSYGINKLVGYHRNSFKLETVSATAVGAGRVVRVNLPENAIIDLKSFRWIINNATAGAVAGTNGAGANSTRNIFPFAQGLIQRLEVTVNGCAVSPGFNEYNTAYRLMRNARVPSSKAFSIDAALQNQTLDTSTGATTAQQIYMVVQDWCGFFGDPSTRFLDTGKTGVISVAITLADDAVCSQVAAAIPNTTVVSSTYTLDSFYFTIDCISLSDGMYDQLIAHKIAKDGSIPISWNEYISFQQDNLTGTTQNQVRFAVSSQSINKLYATLRPSDYTSRGQAPVAISGGTLVESYQPYFFNFKNFATTSPAAPFRWSYQVNNSPHPAYGYATEIEGLSQLALCENKVMFDSPGNQIGSLLEYRNNKFVAAIRLNHPIELGETRNKFISGYDTRGIASQLLFQFQNMANANVAYSAYVLVETTSSLLVGPGRQLSVIN